LAKDKKKEAPVQDENTASEEVKEEKTEAETSAGEEKKEQKKKSESKRESSEVENLKKELEEANDKFLRTAAEYQNFRTRSQKEKESLYNDSKADTLSKIIPVLDNFERASAAEANPEDYKKGIEMIFKQFSDTLTALGVEAFGEAGEPFDPNIHNGVSHIDDENLGENVIATVYQKGYKIGDRIIRHAVVIVAN